MIEVELPDGTIAEFPDGTSNDVIKGALQKRFGAPSTPQFSGGMAGSAALGAADTLSFGIGDEVGAGLGAASEYLASFLNGQDPRSYDEILAKMRDQEDRAQAANPGSFLAGQIGGAVAGGVGLAKGGASLAANAVSRGSSLGRVAAGSAADGAILSAAHGFGTGEGTEDRFKNAGLSALTGTAAGFAGPFAVAGVQKLGGMAAAPIAARLFPENYAQRALGEGVRRSGMTVDDVVDSLGRARADGQDMFTVADALGNSGQRMLSTVARNPSDVRQKVVDALTGRQTGQGDRISNYLAEAFEAPDTAAQRAVSLKDLRSTTADANYQAARTGASPVNLNTAIGEIDALLGRDPILGETALSAGPLGPRLRALRDQLAKGDEQLIDFDKVLNIKSDLYQQMQRNPQVANDMRGVYSQLDAALENSSGAYRTANDTFRQQSKAIDAVDTGRAAASGRMRSSDTVPQFNAMTPDEQAAFRAGYVDPYIARAESMSMSPTTNKARPLITPKTGEEFPAFAASGRGDQLGSRIAREQRMFETANTALGGSKTADNLADAADMARFDPGVMSKMLRGDIIGALADGGRALMSEASGTPPRVIEQLGDALMTTDEIAARRLLEGGIGRLSKSDQLRARVIAAITGAGSAGIGRLGSP
jgi:hypothetical protein